MHRTTSKLSLQDFLALPESGDRYELVEGRPQPKISPKYKHASLQGRLYRLIEIISPGQTFGELTEKATDYLQATVDRV